MMFCMKREDEAVKKTYNQLCDIMEEYYSSGDNFLLEKAYMFVLHAHSRQLTENQNKSMLRALQVAIILARMKINKEVVIAGFIHESREALKELSDLNIQEVFGEEVFSLVESFSSADLTVDNALRKKFLSNELSCVIIKLVDELYDKLKLGI